LNSRQSHSTRERKKGLSAETEGLEGNVKRKKTPTKVYQKGNKGGGGQRSPSELTGTRPKRKGPAHCRTWARGGKKSRKKGKTTATRKGNGQTSGDSPRRATKNGRKKVKKGTTDCNVGRGAIEGKKKNV